MTLFWDLLQVCPLLQHNFFFPAHSLTLLSDFAKVWWNIKRTFLFRSQAGMVLCHDANWKRKLGKIKKKGKPSWQLIIYLLCRLNGDCFLCLLSKWVSGFNWHCCDSSDGRHSLLISSDLSSRQQRSAGGIRLTGATLPKNYRVCQLQFSNLFTTTAWIRFVSFDHALSLQKAENHWSLWF